MSRMRKHVYVTPRNRSVQMGLRAWGEQYFC